MPGAEQVPEQGPMPDQDHSRMDPARVTGNGSLKAIPEVTWAQGCRGPEVRDEWMSFAKLDP